MFLTNCLKCRKRHPLNAEQGGRKLGTIKLRYWLPPRKASLGASIDATTPSDFQYFPLQGFSPSCKEDLTLSNLLTLDKAFYARSLPPCWVVLGNFRKSIPPGLFQKELKAHFPAHVEKFCWPFPSEKTSTPRLTSRGMQHPLAFQGGAGADGSIMETLFQSMPFAAIVQTFPQLNIDGGVGSETPQIHVFPIGTFSKDPLRVSAQDSLALHQQLPFLDAKTHIWFRSAPLKKEREKDRSCVSVTLCKCSATWRSMLCSSRPEETQRSPTKRWEGENGTEAWWRWRLNVSRT